MKTLEILNLLLNYGKGKFLTATYSSDITKDMSAKAKKALAGNLPTITKTTVMTVMSGITYDNRKEVIEARANGNLPMNNAGLPWGTWQAGNEGYIVEHKGNEYIRLYPTYNKDHKINAKTVYSVNGVEMSRAEIMAKGYFNDSYFKPLGTNEDYEMLNFLEIKSQVEELNANEQDTYGKLRKQLMPQCMTIKCDNVLSLG